jgi:hypothetical protein
VSSTFDTDSTAPGTDFIAAEAKLNQSLVLSNFSSTTLLRYFDGVDNWKGELMKRIFLLVVSLATLGLTTAAQTPKATTTTQPKIVTAAQANGVYRYYKSEFRILALGNHKLKVQFDGIYMTLAKSPNMGYAIGEAIIDGNVATFKPPDFEQCTINIVFLPGRIKVTQEGSDADCGFGHNVNATGTYRKIRGGKPKFEAPG